MRYSATKQVFVFVKRSQSRHVDRGPRRALFSLIGLAAAVPAFAQAPRLPVTQFRHACDAVRSVAFSPDGKMLASGAAEIIVWDVGRGNPVSTFRAPEIFSTVLFSPDGKTLASVGFCPAWIRFWDVATGAMRATQHTLPAITTWTNTGCVAFAAEGKTLISAAADDQIRIWDVHSGRSIGVLEPLSGDPIAFSPNAKLLASGEFPTNVVILWDVAARRKIASLKGLAASPACVAFTSDATLVAAGNDVDTIGLWRLSCGNQANLLKGHTNVVRCVAFSPDGKTLASGSEDETVKLWDVATTKNIATLRGHTSLVNSVAFSPDGKILASGSEDGTVKLWEVPPKK